MADTLTISTLSDGTNSTSSTNCIQGSAKAWVNFDGSVASPTIRVSYNVSSVTKLSAGSYIINFTNALVDGNYIISGTACSSPAIANSSTWLNAGTGQLSNFLRTTTQAAVQAIFATTTGAIADTDYITVVFHR